MKVTYLIRGSKGSLECGTRRSLNATQEGIEGSPSCITTSTWAEPFGLCGTNLCTKERIKARFCTGPYFIICTPLVLKELSRTMTSARTISINHPLLFHKNLANQSARPHIAEL